MKLLVAQLQAAVSRLSLRENLEMDALSGAFYLLEKNAELEAGIASGDRAVVESALSDLYVASVWIADGYGVALKKAYQDMGQGVSLNQVLDDRRRRRAERTVADEIRALRSGLTKLIRNIGLYEIGYGEIDAEALPALREVVPEFHVALLDVGLRMGLDVVEGLSGAFRLSSLSGPPAAGHNPVSAKSVRRFTPILNRTYCPFAVTARLWGAAEYDPATTVREHVRSSVESLVRFTRAARREALDGFVLAFPASRFGQDFGQLASLMRTVVATLMEHDPVAPRTFDPADVVGDKWRFSFSGEDYFVPLFAPLYGQDNSRYTYEVGDTVFVVLQPDSSFHSRLAAGRGDVRDQIRQRFADGLQAYRTADEIEAHRFLPPSEPGMPPLRWYDAPETD
jgi:hypothetical protein